MNPKIINHYLYRDILSFFRHDEYLKTIIAM